MAPDDPELIDCTCVHRALKDHEKIEFFCPDGTRFLVAKDCPIHGLTITKEEVAASPDSA